MDWVEAGDSEEDQRLMVEFKTIRQTAATCILSEHYLRMLVKNGECPGIYVGNRFLVNISALSEMLDKMSREAMKE